MPIRVTQTRTRPSNDVAWHDPSLQDAWQTAYMESNIDISEFMLGQESVAVSNDGNTMITEGIYKDLESFIKSQKDVIPSALRQAQRQYRNINGIVATMTYVDTETNVEYTRADVEAVEAQMRAANLLSADHEYFAPRS